MSTRLRVLIAGGGVAAAEALLAVTDAARGLVDVTLLSPQRSLELRPLAVASSFAATRERQRFPLEELAGSRGAPFVLGTVAEVRPADHEVLTADGRSIGYDALILAVGARARPAYEHALTFGPEPLVLTRLLADIEHGSSRRIAFVVPPGVGWPMPVYELALMTRHQAIALALEPEITIVTPESAPLAVFGPAAAERVAALLSAAAIEMRTGAQATVAPSGRVRTEPHGELLDMQRVVAMPVLDGPAIPGIPHDDGGFHPADRHARVVGVSDVYCVGDAADFPIKQGGLATQQADAAALHVAALAGAPVRAEPFRPVLRGRLMTGGADEYFLKEVRRPTGTWSPTPLWWPPTKVSGRYLTPWLASVDPDVLPPEPVGHGMPVEVEVRGHTPLAVPPTKVQEQT